MPPPTNPRQVPFGSSAKPLTKKQRRVLVFVVTFYGEHMRCPSLREIVAGLGMASTNQAAQFLAVLHAKGKIVWDSHCVGNDGAVTSRGIVIPELREEAGKAAERYLKGMG